MKEPAWSAAAFERRYRQQADPWQFARSPYEIQRFDTLLGLLGRSRYERALEVGCSTGELTARLAARCERLVAFDVSPTAAARAARRCANSPKVDVRVADLRDHVPQGAFDLVVLSEVAYYLSPRELEAALERLRAALVPGGELVLSHWLGVSRDHRLGGDEAHAIAEASFARPPDLRRRYPAFRVDVWIERGAEEMGDNGNG